MAEDTDLRSQAIYQLAAALQGQHFTIKVDSKIPRLDVSHDGSGHVVTVDCDRRASDGGALWFHEYGIPIAEADHISDAVVWVKGRTIGNQ